MASCMLSNLVRPTYGSAVSPGDGEEGLPDRDESQHKRRRGHGFVYFLRKILSMLLVFLAIYTSEQIVVPEFLLDGEVTGLRQPGRHLLKCVTMIYQSTLYTTVID